MKRLLLPLILAASVLALAAERTSVAALLKDPAKFHGKDVVATGTVDDFRQRTSRAGNDYFTFLLKDKGQEVNVYGQGKPNPPIKNGDRVEVMGKWSKEKKVGTRTFRNEIGLLKSAKPAPYVKVLKK